MVLYEQIEQIRESSRAMVRELGFLNKHPLAMQISASQFHILLMIQQRGQIQGRELADTLCLDKSTISRSLAAMLKAGWIEVRDDAQDRRAKYHILTEQGLEQLTQGNQQSDQVVKKAISALSEKDRQKIIEGITLYSQALKKARKFSWRIERFSANISPYDIMQMVNHIQTYEFHIQLTPSVNENLSDIPRYFAGKGSQINFWCALDDNDKVIGCLGLAQLGKKDGELKKFFIVHEYRGLGIAQALFDSALAQAKEDKMQQLFLGTTDKFHAAHRFYRRNQFEVIKKSELPKAMKVCDVDTCFFRRQLT